MASRASPSLWTEALREVAKWQSVCVHGEGVGSGQCIQRRVRVLRTCVLSSDQVLAVRP